MKIKPSDEARAVALLTNDVEVTIGTGHADVIRHDASMHRELFNERDDSDYTVEDYLSTVAEGVQQDFHDCFVDTTWPECPLHRRHPLWLRDGSWTCGRVRVAALGELQASRDSAGHYIIRIDRDHTRA